MRQLTIISGAGINYGISAECPFADELINFTYQKISKNVYRRIPEEIRRMFNEDSFDYILGGLMTINLAIEHVKRDIKRFGMNEDAFADIFRQSDLQNSIIFALDQIEQQLRISLPQLIGVLKHFDNAISHLRNEYNSINYFTLNFDGVFDHIIYGENFSRSGETTDYWYGSGGVNKEINRKFKIMHLHGDLRYKPFKVTNYNKATYRWPVIVVGDGEVKKGIIASNEALRFYNQRLRDVCANRGIYSENNLLIIGFGFRSEDDHIVSKIRDGIKNKTFDRIFLYDVEDKLKGMASGYHMISPRDVGLRDLLQNRVDCIGHS